MTIQELINTSVAFFNPVTILTSNVIQVDTFRSIYPRLIKI